MQNQQTDLTANLLDLARGWSDEGLGVAICTVVATWGSSPRQPGAQLVVDDEGRFMGSVSGGCIEGAVIREALRIINEGGTRVLEFGVSDQEAWDVGLACGGRVQVYIERLETALVTT